MPFSYNLPMPALPADAVDSSEDVLFVKFLIEEHEWLQVGTPVAQVQSRSAIIRVDANGRGLLLSRVAKPDKSIKKGDTIATIGADGEEIPYGKPYSLAIVVRYLSPPSPEIPEL
jgi:hypothetical protein